jgi:ABC-type enterobactin transport system permease subunit
VHRSDLVESVRLINDGGVVLSETAVVLARLDEGQGAGREEVLTAADILARGLIAPQELPVGVLTAVLGGSYLLWLMHRRSERAGAL